MTKYYQQLFCSIIFVNFNYNAFSQSLYQEKIWGGPAYETCSSIIHTADNGFAMVGTTTSFGAGLQDIYFSKLDSNENILWTRIYGGALDEVGSCIRQLGDGGYIICGNSASFGAGGNDAYTIRADQDGNVLWSKTYGGSLDEISIVIEPAEDSNFVQVGGTTSYGAGSWDILILKLNYAGDTLWTRIIGGAGYDVGISVAIASDGGYTFCGRGASYGAGQRDVLLFKTDVDGNILWFNSYGGPNPDEGLSVKRTTDNGYIITGSTESFGSIANDVYLLKTDSAGNLEWSKTYGGPKVDATYAVQQTSDGGFITVGFTDSFAYLHLRGITVPPSILGDDSSHVLVIKTDAFGDTLWTRAFGGTRVDEAYSVIQAPDGGYIVGAYENSFSSNDSTDIFFIHMDSLGNSGCHTILINPLVTNPNTITNSYNPAYISGVEVNDALTITDTAAFIYQDPCFGVSVTENSFDETGITVYPNPFSTSATIRLSGITESTGSVMIYDLYGRLVKSIENIALKNNELTIDRGNLAAAVYAIELSAGGKRIWRGKIIAQ